MNVSSSGRLIIPRQLSEVELKAAAKAKKGKAPKTEAQLEQIDRRKRKKDELKLKHNVTSQLGRQRINQQVDAFRSLLPECKDRDFSKLAVLELAVERFVEMRRNLSQLTEQYQKLQGDYQTLYMMSTTMQSELQRLGGSATDAIGLQTDFTSQVLHPSSYSFDGYSYSSSSPVSSSVSTHGCNSPDQVSSFPSSPSSSTTTASHSLPLPSASLPYGLPSYTNDEWDHEELERDFGDEMDSFAPKFKKVKQEDPAAASKPVSIETHQLRTNVPSSIAAHVDRQYSVKEVQTASVQSNLHLVPAFQTAQQQLLQSIPAFDTTPSHYTQHPTHIPFASHNSPSQSALSTLAGFDPLQHPEYITSTSNWPSQVQNEFGELVQNPQTTIFNPQFYHKNLAQHSHHTSEDRYGYPQLDQYSSFDNSLPLSSSSTILYPVNDVTYEAQSPSPYSSPYSYSPSLSSSSPSASSLNYAMFLLMVVGGIPMLSSSGFSVSQSTTSMRSLQSLVSDPSGVFGQVLSLVGDNIGAFSIFASLLLVLVVFYAHQMFSYLWSSNKRSPTKSTSSIQLDMDLTSSISKSKSQKKQHALLKAIESEAIQQHKLQYQTLSKLQQKNIISTRASQLV